MDDSRVHNIRKRSRIQAAFREREEHFRLIIEAAPGSIALFDTQMRYLAVSHRWLADYNMAGRDVLGQSHYDIFPEIPQRWKEIHRRCIAGSTERAEEDRFERADGSVQWLRWEVRPWSLADGAIGGIIIYSEEITERKKAAVELDRIFEFSLDMLCVAGFDGFFKRISPSFEKTLGWSKEEMLSKPFIEFVHLEDREATRDTAKAFEFGRESIVFENRYLCKDGAYKWISWNSHPIVEEKLVIAVARDVSEYKQKEALIRRYAEKAEQGNKVLLREIVNREFAENALRTSEEQFRAIFERAPTGIAIIDSNTGRFIEVNPAYTEIMGYSEDEMLALDFIGITHPDDLQLDMDRMESLRRGAIRHYEMEKRLFRKDGSLVLVQLRVAPLVWSKGALTHHLAIVADITARKQAEAALAANRKLLQDITDFSSAPIYALDSTGRFLLINRKFESIFGKPRESLIGRTRKEIMPFEMARMHYSNDLTVLREQAPIEFEEENLEPDGEHTYLSVKFPLMDDQGAVYGIGGISTDITQRKQIEQRMQMLSHEIIAAREHEKKQVSAVLHHEVGSMAVGISANLNAIEEDLLAGKNGDALKRIKEIRKLFVDSVAHLKGLAGQLRPPELDTVGLPSALRQYFSQFGKHQDVQIHFRETPKLKEIPADIATILFRIAQEALTNAIKHGKAKRVDVTLKASKAAITLAIRDNGNGFDPIKLEAQKTSHMGLRVMREMAHSVKGTFAIDSRRSNGASVRVSLPVAVTASVAGNAHPKQKTALNGSVQKKGNRT